MTQLPDARADRPITVLICALGGEGGAVLSQWLFETALHCGHSAQSTSIPGVAQRTGATTYYLEIHPRPDAELGGRHPVFSLNPVPGALDLLVSSELLETVRQIGLGMVSPDRTMVISSSSRTLTVAEKMPLGDGRVKAAQLLAMVQRYSREARVFDMAALAEQCGTVISAVLLGAVAASGLLPFARDAYEAVIRASGKGVEASLRGFAQAYDRVATELAQQAALLQAAEAGVRSAAPAVLPAALAQRFPAATHEMVGAGHARMLEYQDAAYAALYVERLDRVLQAERSVDPEGTHGWSITRETARYLALWMAFDDIVRVADLKSRASRLQRVRREVKAAEDELVYVYDHFKPGVNELAALLPQGLADRLLRWEQRRLEAGKEPLALPLKVGAHTLSGMLALRVLASLKRLRRWGSRYRQEQLLIERWLDSVERGTRASWALGHEIAQCGRLIKGYGATNERGKHNLRHVLDHLAASFDRPEPCVEAIRAAREAALRDESGKDLDQALVRHGAPPRPAQAQPIRWYKRRPVS
ncbi:indolepyruvate oxidoreductase subunit beta family protein [Caldimonas sp.]|uniref:indolepyruvate oxidoreductase subunit beta family protein n=1 Tax=Caldimonas sp. TaxID=2838790 RepID=UPI0029D5D1DD|nr:indolepyruvate oxidoreductase subunit beta family protein [Caldimonas manganoxidans]